MPERTPDRSFYILFLLFLINLMNFFDRTIPAVVLEPIRKEFALDDTALGLLGASFTLIYAVAGIPLGYLADRFRRTGILAAGLTVWSVLTAASGLAWSFMSFFWIRLSVGVGEASCAPAANSLIGDLFPSDKRARALDDRFHETSVMELMICWWIPCFAIGKARSRIMAGWRRVIELTMTDEEIERLTVLSRSRTEAASRVSRAQMLLAYRENPSFCAVGQRVGVHHQTVQRCVERALGYGPLAAIEDRPRPGKEPVDFPVIHSRESRPRFIAVW